MNKSAIRHIPMSQDAHGVDEKHVVFRLQVGRNDIQKCTLFYGDRACRLTPVIFSDIEMQLVAYDEFFDYYEVVLESPYKRICYYFKLEDGVSYVYYYGDFFTKDLVDDRSEYFQLPFNHRADIAKVPEWTKEAVVYNIFPDSFATSKGYISQKPTERLYGDLTVKGKLGGTIKGITENVDYLVDLGVNCIYINPLFVAGEYHKYDLIDYFNIDPCFGTNEDFAELVRVYHQAGIKVIIDGVFNHCGWAFFAFEDVVQKGEASIYKDWFYGLEFPVVRPDNWDEYPTYACFAYERMMPKLDTSHPEVYDYFMKVCAHWLDVYKIDGWRLDVASECDDAFWRGFRETAKAVNPSCILIGEVWETAAHWLDGSQFDSSMNYDFRKHCRRFFAEDRIDAFEFNARVTNMRMRYRKNMLFGQLNLLDSHDVSRFLSLCDGDVRRYKLAILFMMTFVGMPTIFYGDELGIQGILEDEYRQPMPWGTEGDLHAFFKRAIGLRKAEEALRIGEFRTLYAEKGQKLFVFERFQGQVRLVVAMNPSETAVDLPLALLDGRVVWSENATEEALGAYGFVVLKNVNL